MPFGYNVEIRFRRYRFSDFASALGLLLRVEPPARESC